MRAAGSAQRAYPSCAAKLLAPAGPTPPTTHTELALFQVNFHSRLLGQAVVLQRVMRAADLQRLGRLRRLGVLLLRLVACGGGRAGMPAVRSSGRHGAGVAAER